MAVGLGVGAFVEGFVEGLLLLDGLALLDGVLDGFPLFEGVLDGLLLGVDDGVDVGFPLGVVVGVVVPGVGKVPGIRTPRVGTPGPIELTARTRTNRAVLFLLTV